MDNEDTLDWNETVFRDERVFELDYLPETFKHRDTQMESLKYALRPAIRGSEPLNIVARGPPGTGKSTAIQILFDELAAQTEVKAVRVNCQVDSTRYAVFSRIFADLVNYEPPSEGISFKKLFSQIADKLVNEDQVLVVALDDVNYLFYEDEASDTLYSMLRAHEAHSGAKIGVICVSSDLDLDLIDRLDKRVKSVFRPDEVYFNKYGEAETVDILQERVERGFKEGVVGPTVLDRVAELTAEQDGDLRVGIDLLRRAGMNAERRASQEVESQDVEGAHEQSKFVHLSRRLQELTDSEAALVEVIAEHDGEQAGNIYEVFNEETNLGYTRYSEIINKLDQLGVIDASYNEVEGRGRSRELTLQYDAEAVLDRI